MFLSRNFQIREKPSLQLLDLLEQNVLGTNGAKYRHLDIGHRILEADNPLFLSIERNEKVLGNVTFCRRGDIWYIRYFAFSQFFQASNQPKQMDRSKSLLKSELKAFFDSKFEEGVTTMYAYIDPKNDRSKWMSENFGFRNISSLATQSFSRIYPKKSFRLSEIQDWQSIRARVSEVYSNHRYFFTTHAQKPPFYVLKDEAGEIIACTRATRVHWEIVRLPGKTGGIITKVIPFVPFLNRLIKPKKHTFLVPEIVCVKDNNPRLLEELFSAILFEQKLNLMLWWIDANDPVYLAVKNKVDWGIIHKLIGVASVDVVERKTKVQHESCNQPVFVTAFDMV